MGQKIPTWCVQGKGVETILEMWSKGAGLMDDHLLYDTRECDIVYHGADCYYAGGLRYDHSKA